MSKPIWYDELSSIDCSEHIEKKNGLSYLSWAWAWAELMKRYPLSRSVVHEQDNGSLIWPDPVGGHVKTSVTIVWDDSSEMKEHTVTEYLPVMDMRNKSIPLENIDSMAVNKTIQRSLTKCIARLGLGGYIYAGEDLPEETEYAKQVKAENEAKEAKLMQDIAKLVTDVDAAIKPKVTKMTQEEKVKFVNEVISPIIGQANYKTCKNIDKLTLLLETVKAA